MKHTIHLRQDKVLSIELPDNLTPREARRLSVAVSNFRFDPLESYSFGVENKVSLRFSKVVENQKQAGKY